MSNAKNPVSGGSVTQDGGEEAPPATPATTTAPLAWKVPGKAGEDAAASVNNPAADKVGTVTATLPDEPAAEKKPTDEAGTKTDDQAVTTQKEVDTATSKPDEPVVVDKKPASSTSTVVFAWVTPRKVGNGVAASPDESGDEAAKQAKKVADAKAAVALEEERGKANAQAEAEMGFAATKKEKVPENLIWLAIAAIVIGLLIFIAVQLSSRKPGDVAATPPAPTALTAPSTTEWSKGGSQPSEY